MKKKVTKHALKRAMERFGDNYRQKRIRNALLYGHIPTDFKGEFRDYLQAILKKNSKSKSIKIHEDMLVLYNKRNQKVITTWKVPDKYLPTGKFR